MMRNTRHNATPLVILGLVVAGLATVMWTLGTSDGPPSAPPANGVNTSNWKIFRHPIYPYEIAYPPEGSIDRYTDGHTVGISVLNTDGDETRVTIEPTYGEQKGIEVDEDFDLKAFAAEQATVTPTSPTISEFAGKYVQGYEMTFVLNDPDSLTGAPTFVLTTVFVIHDKRLYDITFTENELARAIVGTLWFAE